MSRKINTRSQFVDYCLRQIGAPVLEINLDSEQIEDRVDQALNKFWEFHYDGKERVFLVHQVTQNDHNNKFIIVPRNFIGVTRIMPISSAFSVGSVFSLQYQIVLQDMWRWSSVQMTHYYQIYQYSQMIEQLLVGLQPIRFNANNNRLYIDMIWERVPVGNYIVADGFRIVDPDLYCLTLTNINGTFLADETITTNTGLSARVDSANLTSVYDLNVYKWTGLILPGMTITGTQSGATATVSMVYDNLDTWNNKWLQDYATALIKENWGNVLTKYTNVRLPGGQVLNGNGILQEAQAKISSLESELYNTYNMPIEGFIN